MKKFIFGVLAVIVISIVIVSLPKNSHINTEKDVGEATDDSIYEFCIETLSDKDIYYHVDEAGVCREFLPDSVRGLVDDLIDAANGFAIIGMLIVMRSYGSDSV